MGKRKYTTELKMAIVNAAIRSKKPIAALAEEYAIDGSVIRKWVTAYKQSGVEGIERTHGKYSPEFKLLVVEDLRKNGLSYSAAALKYNIGLHVTVQKWERQYLENGYVGLNVDNRGCASRAAGSDKGRKPIFKQAPNEDLIAENQRLKMENEYLKKLNALIRAKEN